jgi:hypothetical protein
MYFNKRHKRSGTLFQGVYKAARINSDSYWQHISRYIHLNPLDLGKDYIEYPYSSFRFYIGKAHSDWLRPDKVASCFKSKSEYANFVKEYIPYRNELKELKEVLANSSELA